jgi:hypothetical protein
MRAFLILLILAVLPGCGALGGFSRAIQESGALQERADSLEGKLDLLKQTLEAYGPLAEDLGPEIKEKYEELLEQYGKVQGYVAEGKELLGQATELHQKSLAQATDPDTGETDWIQYALLMLLGGGGLYGERRKTKKERDRLHQRLDKRKGEVAGLEDQLRELVKQIEIQQAKNGAAS